MYPAGFFELFPPFPRDNKVFVAMSFESRFEKRWKEVIVPGIRKASFGKVRLEPMRVDTRKVSDSILTEILTGIANSRFVFADITTVGHLAVDRPIRNGNVMYEVGIAQAVRLPEEVILFRSDDDSLLFDTSNVRVNRYTPDETPEEASSQIADALVSASRELDLTRHLAVRRISGSLDFPSWWLLAESQFGPGVPHPKMNLANALRATAITRLLELGLLKTSYLEATPELLEEMGDSPFTQLLTYEPTEFGKAVFKDGIQRLGILSPEMGAYLRQKFPSPPDKPEKQSEEQSEEQPGDPVS